MAAGKPRPLLIGMEWFPDKPGGLNRYFRDLLETLRGGGVPADAVVSGPIAAPVAGVMAARSKWGLAWRLLEMARLASRASAQADLVDAHFALHAFVPVRLGRLRRAPLVVHFQGPWAAESASDGETRGAVLAAKAALERSVYRHARQAIVLSGAFRTILIERYGVSPWRVNVIPPGVDLERFRPGPRREARQELGIPEDASVALAVRRLIPRVGLEVLLDAWGQIASDSDGATLLIAGEGFEREALEARAARLGVAHAVRFLGSVSEEQLQRCYQAADVSVVPSVALEGFGLVVLESLACGTPVIASDVGGLPEALAGLDSRLVVPAGEVGPLATALSGAFAGTLPLPSVEQCRAFAESRSWESVAARTLAVYQEAVDPTPPTRHRVVYLDHCAELSGGELALAGVLPALDVDAHVILAEAGPLVARLLRSGISVQVLAMSEAARGLRRDRVRPGGLPLGSVIGSARYVLRLTRQLRRLRPDIVHTNSLKSALYGGIAGRLAGIPVVWHLRDRIAADYLPGPAVRMIRVLARVVPAAVIGNSQATVDTLHGAARIARVIPSVAVAGAGPTPSGSSRIAGDSRGPAPTGQEVLRVGMLGRIAPWKGQHVFIEAFARAFPVKVPSAAVAARATIVGSPLFGEEPYEEQLKELVASHGLEDRLDFAGFVDDVPGCLAGLDVLVHASVIPEPFGQVVVQGMAAGLPVLAARAGGPAELIDDGVTGLLYTPGDAAALADGLRKLAGDPKLRRQLGEAARERTAEFTAEALAPKYLEIYGEVLARH